MVRASSGSFVHFGLLLRTFRETCLLSQDELASRSGVSVRAIRYFEGDGDRRPRPASVRLLADALELDGRARRDFERAAAHSGGTNQSVDGSPVPAQLPVDVTDFVGREDEARALDGLLDRNGDRAVRTAVVVGTAGVGKTALVVHWAHRRVERFPDGQLFLDLRGYAAEQPVDAGDALARLLRGLGVPAGAVPLDPEERAALYRTTVADRRVLVVLDNGSSVEQVRPLLPGSPGCLTLVTSRDSLGGLAVREGARRFELDVLTPALAEHLLARLIGGRAAAEPAAVVRLASQCARLPLALRVAADLVAERPAVALDELVSELDLEEQRLERLDAGGDPRSDVAAVLSWSYRRLPPEVARLFRLFGLHPGPAIDGSAVAALAGSPVSDTNRTLTILLRTHLITEPSAGLFWMHDLLHAYASRLAAEEDAPSVRRLALDRLYLHYWATAAAAMDRILPAGRPQRRSPPQVPPSVPAFADEAAATAWLDAVRPVLGNRALRPPVDVSVGLSSTLSRHLYDGGHSSEALVVHERALELARSAGTREGEAIALRGLATVYWRGGRLARAAELSLLAADTARAAGAPLVEAMALGDRGGITGQQARYDEAEELFGRALDLYRQLGVRSGEVLTSLNLGVVHERRGRLDRAAELYGAAGEIAREIGDRRGEARALANLAEVARQRGDDSAEAIFRRAIELLDAVGARVQEGRALNGLATLCLLQQRLTEAVAAHERALGLFRRSDDQVGEGWTLDGLARCHTAQGRHEDALATFGRSLRLFEATGDRTGTISSLNGLGDALLNLGRADDAAERYGEARQDAVDTGDLSEQARALVGLGAASRSLGDLVGARHHWRAARDLLETAGMAGAEEISAQLERLDTRTT